MDRLRTLLNLRRGEEVPVFLLFSYLALALTCYVIIKAVRSGIFLHRFSAMELPLVYIAIPVVTGLVVAPYIRVSRRINQAWLISGTLLFFIANLVMLWFAVRAGWKAAPWIFYVWASLFGIIITTQAWTVANGVLDLRQAKRVFPLLSSGGILGGGLGGLVAKRLVRSIGTEHLMLVVIPILFLLIGLVQFLVRRYSLPGRTSTTGAATAETQTDFRAVAKMILASPYLRLIVGLLALSAIVTMIVDWQFQSFGQTVYGRSQDKLTGFFASFYMYLAFGAFLLQAAAGSRIVEKLGVRAILFILPVALTLGTATLVAFPLALWAIAGLKGSDYTIRYSIDKSTTELLYVPVAQSVKTQIKAMIDMIIQRFADGVAGLLLLFVTRVLNQGQGGVGIFNLLLLGVWLWVVVRIRKEYVVTVRSRITDRPDLSKSTIRNVFDNQVSIATLKSMLASRDEEVLIYAMEMAVALGRSNWIRRELVTHPSPRVRLRALELAPLSENELLERVKVESNSSVRISAILRAAAQISGAGQRGSALVQFLNSPDLRVRLSALAGLASHPGDLPSGTITKALDRIAADLGPDSPHWKEVAEALGDIRHPEAVPLHLRLLQGSDLAVRKAAIASAGRAGHREVVPFLVPLLRDARWGPDARLALREYGPRILGTLADMFKDPTEDLEIRRSIPLVLAYVPQQEAVDILLDGLFDYDGLLRYRAIRALGKLRLLDPDLHFDRQKVSLRLREEAENSLWCRQALAVLYPTDGSKDLLAQLLKDKISRGRDRVFRLLALLLPPTAAIASLLAVTEDDRLRRAAVAEFMDNVLPGRLREYVLPVIEPTARALRSKQSVRQILEACLRSPDSILRECTADAIAKQRWPEYRGLVPTMAAQKGDLNNG